MLDRYLHEYGPSLASPGLISAPKAAPLWLLGVAHCGWYDVAQHTGAHTGERATPTGEQNLVKLVKAHQIHSSLGPKLCPASSDLHPHSYRWHLAP
ncbi:hypothetical protein XENTR_v10004495 [Xenopus tropicalis]|nr:hypothetical protein XENTR_v10004495 [Xenopus tropicalis]